MVIPNWLGAFVSRLNTLRARSSSRRDDSLKRHDISRGVELFEDRTLLASTPVVNLTSAPPSNIDEGDSFSISGTATHSGSESINVYVRWYGGTGSSTSSSSSPWYDDSAQISPGDSFSFWQLYDDNDQLTVSVWASVIDNGTTSTGTTTTGTTSGSTSGTTTSGTSTSGTTGTGSQTLMSSPDSYSVTVDNVAPTLNVTDPTGSSISVKQGDYFSISGDASDPGADTLMLSVDWNDGTTSTPSSSSVSSGSFTRSYSYWNTGTYSVALTLTDDDGGSDAKNLTVNVTPDDAPVVSVSEWPSGDEGYPPMGTGTSTMTSTSAGSGLTLSASITDNNSQISKITVNWGESTESGAAITETFYSSSSFSTASTFTAYHAYGDDGQYTVTLTAYDNFGNATAESNTVTIDNVAPEAAINGWPETGTSSMSPTTSMTMTGTTTMTPTTSMTTTGTTATPTTTSSSATSSIPTIVVGDVYSITGFGRDVGWKDDLTLSVDWEGGGFVPDENDPTIPATGTTPTISGKPELSGNFEFVYNEPGNHTITLTVADDEGDTATATTAIKVAPKAVSDTNIIAVDSVALVTDIASNDKYDATSPATFSVVDVPGSGGSAVIDGSGELTYDAPDGWWGVDTFTYEITQNGVTSPKATVTVAVASLRITMSVPGFFAGSDDITDPVIGPINPAQRWVGQRIGIGAEVKLPASYSQADITISNHAWSIPGTVVEGYDVDLYNGVVDPLTSSERNNASVSFYWIDATDPAPGTFEQILLTADIAIDLDGDFIADESFSGATSSASVIVSKPTPAVSAFTDTVKSSGPANAESAYSFGEPGGDPNPNGIDIKRLDDGGAPGGTYAWISLVTSYSYRTDTNGDSENRTLNGANDSNIQELGPNDGLLFPGEDFFDSPQEPLSDDYTYYSRRDDFDTYLTWRPAGGNSINVPLALVSWHWSFEATAVAGDWTLSSSSHSVYNGPLTGIEVAGYLPTWNTSRFTELGENGDEGWETTTYPPPPPLPEP